MSKVSCFFYSHCSCQDLPAFDWNSEYSQLVTNNSRKNSNYTVVHAHW